MNKIKLTIVIPTYNERENIKPLLERLEASLKNIDGGFEVIIVDDDSPDKTWAIAEELARTRFPWLRVVRRIGEKGLASAVVKGFQLSRGEYIVVMDADLQHPPETVPSLVKAAEETRADIVVASRYTRGGGVEGWSRLRLLISRAATLLAYLLLPEAKTTTDPMSGFFLVRRDLVSNCLSMLKPRGYKILLELIVRCKPRRVVDVPYVFAKRVHGESKLGVATVVDYVRQLLELNNYRFLKMAFVGSLGILVLYLVNLLLMGLGVPRLASYAAAIEASILHNFALNNLWTFRERGEDPLTLKLIKYHYSVALGALTNYSLYQLLTNIIGLADEPSIIVGVAAGYLTNYLLAEHHVWSVKANNPTR